MATALKVKETNRIDHDEDFIERILSSENDDAGGLDDAPTERLNRLATQLIERRRRQSAPIRIDVSGLPHEALISFAEELEKLGVSYDLSADLVAAIKEYWIRRGASFTRAAKAKPIWIVLDVTDRKPEKTFRNGLADVVALTGAARVGEFATTITRTLAYGGGGTTSNAGADRVFDAVWGKMSVWLMTESPSRQDLDGLDALGTALTGIAGMAGGGMSAKEIQDIIQQVLKESGPGGLPADAIALIDAIMKMKEAAVAPNMNPEMMAQLSRDIARLIDIGDMPPALIQAVTTAIETLNRTPGLSVILMENGLAPLVAQNDNLALNEAIGEIIEQLETLAEIEGIDDALKADIENIVQQIQESLAQKTIQPADMLAALQAQLSDLATNKTLPSATFSALADILPAVAEAKAMSLIIAADTSAENTAQILTEQMADIVTKIEVGEINPAELPPEIQTLIETLGGTEHLQTLINHENGQAELQSTITDALNGDMTTPELMQAIQSAAPILSVLSETAANTGAHIQDTPTKIDAVKIDFLSIPTENHNLIAPSSKAGQIQSAPPQESERSTFTRIIAEATNYMSATQTTILPPTANITPTTTSQGTKTSETTVHTQTPGTPKNTETSAKLSPTSAQNTAPSNQTDLAKNTVTLPPRIESVIKSVIQQIAKETAGTQQMPTSMKVVLQSLKPLQNLIQSVQEGKSITGERVNQTLRALDTALSKAVPPTLRQAITTLRNSIADAAQKITGVDPSLKSEPGKGNCPPPCQCGPKKPFDKAAPPTIIGADGKPKEQVVVTEEQIAKSREQINAIAKKHRIETGTGISENDHQALLEARKRNDQKKSAIVDFSSCADGTCGHDHSGEPAGNDPPAAPINDDTIDTSVRVEAPLDNNAWAQAWTNTP